MCLSRGRKNIKIYNTATGKVIKILKSPKEADYRIDSFFVSMYMYRSCDLCIQSYSH